MGSPAVRRFPFVLRDPASSHLFWHIIDLPVLLQPHYRLSEFLYSFVQNPEAQVFLVFRFGCSCPINHLNEVMFRQQRSSCRKISEKTYEITYFVRFDNIVNTYFIQYF